MCCYIQVNDMGTFSHSVSHPEYQFVPQGLIHQMKPHMSLHASYIFQLTMLTWHVGRHLCLENHMLVHLKGTKRTFAHSKSIYANMQITTINFYSISLKKNLI